MLSPLSTSATAKYNRALQRRHPKVRVRWSHFRGFWTLEERVYNTRELNPDDYPADLTDAYVQHRDGYVTIEHMRELPPVRRLSDALEFSRISHLMQLAGADSASDWADKLDAEHARELERDREHFRDIVGEAASDEWDRAQWRTGSRAGGYIKGL